MFTEDLLPEQAFHQYHLSLKKVLEQIIQEINEDAYDEHHIELESYDVEGCQINMTISIGKQDKTHHDLVVDFFDEEGGESIIIKNQTKENSILEYLITDLFEPLFFKYAA